MTVKHKDKGVIHLGETTDHGGKVISAHSPLDMGKQIACVGDMTVCPKCKGAFSHCRRRCGLRDWGRTRCLSRSQNRLRGIAHQFGIDNPGREKLLKME